MRPDRRTLLAGSAALAATGLLPRPAHAQSGFGPQRHGFSAFGDLAYGPEATHFAYVNPDAPKGGSVALQISRTQGNQAFDTFNTLNIYVLKGDGAPVPGLYAVGEAAGFGGGGIHGRGSLEGTFLGGCVLTGRVVAAAM